MRVAPSELTFVRRAACTAVFLLCTLSGGAGAQETAPREPAPAEDDAPTEDEEWRGFIRLRGIPIPVGANGQLTLTGAHTDFGDGDVNEAELGYDWFFRRDMMLGLGITYVDSDFPGRGDRGIGNTRISYSYLPYEKPPKHRLQPFGVALLIDVFAPTGQLARGTGGGGWRVEAGVVVGLQPTERLQILPAVRYTESYGEGHGPDLNFLGVEAGLLYEPARFLSWLLYLPRYSYDFDFEEYSLNHGFQVGKMLTDQIGVFGSYSLIERTRIESSGFDKDMRLGILYAW